MLLPPEGFGKKARTKKQSKTGVQEIKSKGIKVSIMSSKAKYKNGEVNLPIKLNGKLKKDLEFKLDVITDGTGILLEDWKKTLGIDYPFELKSFKVSNASIDGNKEKIELRNFKSIDIKGTKIETLLNYEGIGIGIGIKSNVEHVVKIDLVLSIKVQNDSVEVGYKFKEID